MATESKVVRTRELVSEDIEAILRALVNLTSERFDRYREAKVITEDEIYEAKKEWLDAELELARYLEGKKDEGTKPQEPPSRGQSPAASA